MYASSYVRYSIAPNPGNTWAIFTGHTPLHLASRLCLFLQLLNLLVLLPLRLRKPRISLLRRGGILSVLGLGLVDQRVDVGFFELLAEGALGVV